MKVHVWTQLMIFVNSNSYMNKQMVKYKVIVTCFGKNV